MWAAWHPQYAGEPEIEIFGVTPPMPFREAAAVPTNERQERSPPQWQRQQPDRRGQPRVYVPDPAPMTQTQVQHVQESLAHLQQIRLFRRGTTDVVEPVTAGMQCDTIPPGTFTRQSAEATVPDQAERNDIERRVVSSLQSLTPSERLIPEQRPNYNLPTQEATPATSQQQGTATPAAAEQDDVTQTRDSEG